MAADRKATAPGAHRAENTDHGRRVVSTSSRQDIDAAVIKPRRPRGWLAAGGRHYLAVAIIVLWCLIPFYWMLVTAFRDKAHVFDKTPWPTHLTFDNFHQALQTDTGQNLPRALGNSLIIGAATTAISVVVGIFAAYALARINFRGKYFVTGIILAASMFPSIALATPLYQMFSEIGWIGQYQALILPNISFALPLTIYTLTAFFSDLPWELEEAARVDGATRAQAFRIVILPLAAPALFTAAILAFIASWNEFLLASLLSNDKTEPVTVAIARFQGEQGGFQFPYSAVMAAGAIVAVPLVVVVLIFQRRIVSGLTAGGVKS